MLKVTGEGKRIFGKMSRKNCLHCGTSSHAEARFCRLCGASLRDVPVGDSIASPIDATVPLPRDLHPASSINREELDAFISGASLIPAHATIAKQEGETHDSEATLVSPVHTLPVAQTSALSPSRVTELVQSGELPPITSNVEHARLSAAYSTAEQKFDEGVVATGRPHTKSWQWWLLASMCVATIAAVLTLATLTLMYSRRTTARIEGMNESAAAELPEARSESLRLTAEAESLLAAGATEAAITRLREAVRLDERNARAQLQLGAALERTGRRSEAIVFYQAAAALAPNDPQAWEPLAEAQFDDGRFAEAAQSYQRFFNLIETVAHGGASRLNDATRLRYAEALRLAGASEQAQSLLAQVNGAAPEGSAGEEGRGVTSVPPVVSTSASDAARDTAARPKSLTFPPAASSTPSAAAARNSAETRLPPQERYERAVRLYSADRQTALKEFAAIANRVPDAHYYLGLARTEGRPLQSIHRAVLLEALKHFQTAQNTGGRHSAQAKRLADQLGREYDRRRKQR